MRRGKFAKKRSKKSPVRVPTLCSMFMMHKGGSPPRPPTPAQPSNKSPPGPTNRPAGDWRQKPCREDRLLTCSCLCGCVRTCPVSAFRSTLTAWTLVLAMAWTGIFSTSGFCSSRIGKHSEGVFHTAAYRTQQVPLQGLIPSLGNSPLLTTTAPNAPFYAYDFMARLCRKQVDAAHLSPGHNHPSKAVIFAYDGLHHPASEPTRLTGFGMDFAHAKPEGQRHREAMSSQTIAASPRQIGVNSAASYTYDDNRDHDNDNDYKLNRLDRATASIPANAGGSGGEIDGVAGAPEFEGRSQENRPAATTSASGVLFGRFWSLDEFEGFNSSPLSLHKYLYANGNPASYTDPSGNVTLTEVALTSSLTGLLTGAAFGFNNGWIEGQLQGKQGAELLEEALIQMAMGATIGAIVAPIMTLYPETIPLFVSYGIFSGGVASYSAFEQGHISLGIWRATIGIMLAWTGRGAIQRPGLPPIGPNSGPSGIPRANPPVPKKPGGSTDTDFISPHAIKHKYDPSRPSTKNRTQFGEDVDVGEVRRQTMTDPDNIYSDVRSQSTAYEKEFGGNISTPDTPTPHSRVYDNPDPTRSTQFPYVPRR